jgi:glycosyltransferase involved in cell wall biosynthesis
VAFSPHAYWPSIGGAERYCQGLAEGLSGLDHEVHVVVADVDDPEAFYELGHQTSGQTDRTIEGVSVHRLRFVEFGYRKMGRVLGQRRVLASAIARFQALLGDRLDEIEPEVVVTLPHLFPNVEEVIRRRRKTASWKLVYAPLLHEDDPYWSIERVSAAVRASDAVIALTDHERDRLLESYGAASRMTALIPPGVGTDMSVQYENRDPIVLFVGRRTASKRLEVLYEAMKIVWEDHPDVVLQVAGSPPGVGRDPAVWMAADPRVEIVTAPSEQQKDDLLGKARVVVSPSLKESFGITTLEAWAHGTPVVLVDSPVNRSVVRDQVDGLLSERAEAVDLARSIAEVTSNPERAMSMGRAGRQRVESEFTWERSAQVLNELVQRL